MILDSCRRVSALHMDWSARQHPPCDRCRNALRYAAWPGNVPGGVQSCRLLTRRLATLNALATSVARVSQGGSMAATELKELKDLMGADAAWFRLLQENRLIVHQQFGLSPEFLSKRSSVAANDEVERIPEQPRPAVNFRAGTE